MYHCMPCLKPSPSKLLLRTQIGRMAGQFAKPRSGDFETIDGVSLPSYRGDIINSAAFTTEARTPDPNRCSAHLNPSAAQIRLHPIMRPKQYSLCCTLLSGWWLLCGLRCRDEDV